MPAQVAQLAACTTGDQEVAGLTLPGRQHSFVVLSLLLIQEGQLSVSGERYIIIS